LSDKLRELYTRIESVIRNAGQTTATPVVAMKQRQGVFRLFGQSGKQRRFAIAAAIIFLIAATAVWLTSNTDYSSGAGNNSNLSINDIQPGRQGAILTLADGSIVELDSLSNGNLINQGISVVRKKDGLIEYVHTENVSVNAETSIQYNTLSTPPGRQFRLSLPDGTQVWLNAGSSVRFPTQFTSSKREISVTGEVYLEVVKDAEKPFFVNVDNRAEVEVLGTSFNINAYNDEPILATTLIEGSLKMHVVAENLKSESVLLKPGQQGRLQEVAGHPNNSNISRLTVSDQNREMIEKITAWKNGLFNFDNANITQVMRQISRWYNVTVEYEGQVPNHTFLGKLGRDMTLSEILAVLQKTGVNFRLEEGRRLIVYP
ncbi:MAG TPA: FecR domain-containing protein, partial [Parasegetibacter sp.]